jgi:hypothetical protein
MRSLTAISEASEAVASNVENATPFRAVPAIIARPGRDLDRPVDRRLAALRRDFEARGKPKDAPPAGKGRSDH